MEIDISYLNKLNPQQRQAVKHFGSPLLILAGAGTGKTRVLVSRIIHLIKKHQVFANNILAVTFTNKAANEMKERITEHLEKAEQIPRWIGTFHSICAQILRKYAHLVNLQSNFTIINQDDQLQLIKQILKSDKLLPEHELKPIEIINKINHWKNRGSDLDSVINTKDSETDAIIYEIYKEYQERLLTLNSVDFGDLLCHIVKIFLNYDDILKLYQKTFSHILVDEYQDTNIIQYRLLKLLGMGNNNICVVGDDDQSIYGWRGAEINNILGFPNTFKGSKTIRLEQNYRSSANILEAATAIIDHNQNRLGKILYTSGPSGEKVTLKGFFTSEDEAVYVTKTLANIQSNNSTSAILVRATSQMREIEEKLILAGLPYVVIGGLRFYERLEIRDTIAYLRIVAQPNDSLAFERIINKPKRKIGVNTVAKLHLYSREQKCSLFEAAKAVCKNNIIKKAQQQSLIKLIDKINTWRFKAQDLNLPELAQLILEESNYINMWKEAKTPDATNRLDNIQELISYLHDFSDLQSFLEYVSLVNETSNPNTKSSIYLMTLHAAKGLEFDNVYLTGWEEGLFPHQRALGENNSLEEERRLAYVGITRAKYKLHICYANHRKIHGTLQSSVASRFIYELPEQIRESKSTQAKVTKIYNHEPSKQFYSKHYRSDLDPSANNVIELSQYRKSNLQSFTKKQHTTKSRPYRSKYRIKQTVSHLKFGKGVITNIDGTKLVITFEDGITRNIIDSFIIPSNND